MFVRILNLRVRKWPILFTELEYLTKKKQKLELTTFCATVSVTFKELLETINSVENGHNSCLL